MGAIAQQLSLFIYNNIIRSSISGKNPRFWIKARKRVLRYCDPVIDMNLDDVQISINLSHNLPINYISNEKYDRLLPKVCSYLQCEQGFMKLIDVGANVGDTVCFVDKKSNGLALCVEGDSKYTSLLQKNASRLKNLQITIAPVFCTEEDSTNQAYDIKNGGGTSTLVATDSENTVPLMTLDALVAQFSDFSDANILKIDTDGFEAKTLMGGKKYIASAKPMVFFEFVPRNFIYKQLPDSEEEESFLILNSMGYDSALFFDNAGCYQGQVKTSDSVAIKELICKINMRDICYYDILTCHKDNTTHEGILTRIRLEEKAGSPSA